MIKPSSYRERRRALARTFFRYRFTVLYGEAPCLPMMFASGAYIFRLAIYLDDIAKRKTATTAQAVYATIRSIMNWKAKRSNKYISPLAKGMRWDHREASERARKRILDDDEMRAVWRATEGIGPYGAIVRLLLLTGQRRDKVATMK